MLVLQRKPREEIVIETSDGIITVCVVDKRGHIGIDAPPNVAVHRREVWERIQEERRK